MTIKMVTLREILENPPYKSVTCPRCDGDRIINRRGMICSDPCPTCKINKWESKGTITVINYDLFEQHIKEFFVTGRIDDR